MFKDLPEREQHMYDLLLTTFIQTQTAENHTTIPLMIKVPVLWLQYVKTIVDRSPDVELGDIIESILLDIFMTGLNESLTDLKKRYLNPMDVIEKVYGFKA
uniref:Uncharacterized protein n=1 Tax=viral metagenome TaxID=1070528 RepID=A0A6M3X827_9ZZZZ